MSSTNRVISIDLLRGVVIVIMALDHIRDYFNADAYLFDPTDLSRTSGMLFFTRWVTHFCAPVFVFLAGTAAFQVGLRRGTQKLGEFLVKRGLWLLVLEFTLINFAWFFNIHFSFIALTVIWALGIGMIFLAVMIRLPLRWIALVSAVVIAGHNMLDGIHYSAGPAKFIWPVIHEQALLSWGQGRLLFTGYGLIPWVLVMSLGYCFGALYTPSFNPRRRKKLLIIFGMGALLLFVFLRLINVYGDPFPWSGQPTLLFTFLSFFNTTKYPPSLDYLLMTLGPALLFLAATETVSGRLTETFLVFGRTPLFFYVIHLYVLHIMALGAAVLSGFSPGDMVFDVWITASPHLKGYGFNLPVVYGIWVAVIVMLYPLCRLFDDYKKRNKEKWWLSYL